MNVNKECWNWHFYARCIDDDDDNDDSERNDVRRAISLTQGIENGFRCEVHCSTSLNNSRG